MKVGVITTVAGAARYEFRMQVRRKAVWIVMFSFGLLVFAGPNTPWEFPKGTPAWSVVGNWAFMIQIFMPVALGCLLADRLPRDRRTGVDELLETLPELPGGRLVGKYFGATLATLVPLSLIYAAGVAYAVADRGDPGAIPLALMAFTVINLPGLSFVAALSVSCPAVLRVPLYQFLFVGYWFWGNLHPPGTTIPTPSGTWLTPVDGYAAAGFFGVDAPWIGKVAAWEGAASVTLLLGLGALTLLCAHRYLRWQHARR